MPSCPPDDCLEAFLDELLSSPEREGLEQHIAICPLCQASLERLTEAPEALRQPLISVMDLSISDCGLDLPLLLARSGEAPRPGED